MSEEVRKAICEHCHSRCRVLVHSEDGRLKKIEEDRSDPWVDNVFPPTKACLRLRGVTEWFYHPDRVNFPLKRKGERGEGKWERISWEQAFDEIAERLKRLMDKYGPETLAMTVGTQRTQEEMTSRFCNVLGTPNVDGQSKICFAPLCVVSGAMFGWPPRHKSTMTVLKEGGSSPTTRCMFMIGMDPSQSYQRVWKVVRDAKKYGVKIMVADPRRTETAELADIWLQHKPATDTALLMSMINVIIEEGLYDKDFVTEWCHGFEELVERARDYPPEKVAGMTWVPAGTIRAAARMYATNRPAISANGMGTEHLTNSIEAIQARLIMGAITGNIDVEGGETLSGPARFMMEAEVALPEVISPEQKAKQLGIDRFRLVSWPGSDLIQGNVKRVWGQRYLCSRLDATAHLPTILRAMITGKPYPVRACIGVASNPMVTQANTKLVYKALKSLDLYVVMDYWMTPSAELADYVLATASWVERPFIYSTGGGISNSIRGGEKALPSAIPGEYDHRTDYEVYRELALRLGKGEYFPWKTLEESYTERLKPLGMTFEEFMAQGGCDFPPAKYKQYEKIGFATPTGKVELYSTIFEKLGYDPLPRYEEAPESPESNPELAKEYPLMLISGGRFLPMYHSEHRQVDSVRKRHPHPLVQINPKTASKLEINDGDWVWIETLRGRIRMKCRYFDGIDPRVVHAEHGWWFPELPGEEPWLHGVWESNVNVLTDDSDVCNKLSGGWPLKTALCKVYKVKTY